MTKLYTLMLALFILSATAFSQTYNVSGKVIDGSNGEALIGANVYVKDFGRGAASDGSGKYTIPVPAGTYTIVCSYVGFETVEKEIQVTGDLALNFSLKEHQFTLNVTVISDRAKERETPVAFTNIDKKQIEFNLGSRDIPLVLNTTPSVFATDNGGGAGDARVNVRGFNQRNVAVMINGIPVNDMENGWVYWSNWDGLGDATASIQVQRGMSAVNLATPSIGGTMNIITDPSQLKAGVSYKNEIGSGNFSKQTLFANTGLVDDKFAFSFGGVRKTGDGVVDRAWTDAWAYYMGAAYQIGTSNRIELYAMGAPQAHGQRRWRLNAATFSHELARELGYDESVLKEAKLREQGTLYNSNWSPISSSYQGLQHQRSYWNSDRNLRYDPSYMNESVNYFHKPLVNLNWYSQFSNVFSLYSTVYWSGGQGGGAGTFGSLNYNTSLQQRVVDWDATITRNRANFDSVDFNGDGIKERYIVSTNLSGQPMGRGGILRNSVNDQWTVGAISKAYWKASNNLNTSFGIDVRTAEIQHYREVRDLLGNDYYYFIGNQFESGLDYYKQLGDRIDYNNTNKVSWVGGYGQAEYTADRFTIYGTAGYSMVKFDYVDHFKFNADSTGELNLVSDWIGGYQLKGGASFRATAQTDLFVNAGYVSKVPIFDQVISDVDGTMNPDPKNEQFISFELGANTRLLNNMLSLKANLYFTNWLDRAVNRVVLNADGTDGLVKLDGIDSRHMGFELEAAYQPTRFARLDLAFSYGIWEYTNDVSGSYVIDFSTGTTLDYDFYIKDLKVGDAPQMQLAAAVTVFPVPGLQAQLVWRFYDQYYSDFDPFSRSDSSDRAQVWQIPSYSLVDFNLAYRVPGTVAGMDVTIFGHVFNVLDELFVQDATDNSAFNAWTGDRDPITNPTGRMHKADDAEVYPGLPRTFNAGFRIGL